ncbi:MAG: EAL domain-containing protein [Acidobacteria bacterium]|nr:MAG: EAL domain-containing protein [Acidobacteriota bacterium]
MRRRASPSGRTPAGGRAAGRTGFRPAGSVAELLDGNDPRMAFHGIYDVAGEPSVHAYEALMRGPRGLPFEGPMLAFAFARSVDLLAELDLECVRCALASAPAGRRLFLNVHPTTLTDRGFETVSGLVAASGRAPAEVVFEVVEHGPDRESELLASLGGLRRAGFGIAVDDFGEGASNLRRLLRVRPDYLKLDRWFVNGADEDPDRRAVIRATARLGRDLGLRVVAEGVRSAALLDVVRTAGVELVQCFRYLPPGLVDPLAEGTAEGTCREALDPAAPDSPVLLGIDSFAERDLDALPFGVIQLSRDGTILQYNRYEEDLARRRASEVIGKNFFTEVAPCTDVRAFAGRFREGVARGELHVTFDYVFAFSPPKPVRVTLWYSGATRTGWVFVQG